jgi:hypothetical protein
MQERKNIFVFLEFISAENKSASNSVGKVFLITKIGPGSWVHLSTLS